MTFRARALFELVVECACFLAVRVEESDNDTDMMAVRGKLPPKASFKILLFHVAINLPQPVQPRSHPNPLSGIRSDLKAKNRLSPGDRDLESKT